MPLPSGRCRKASPSDSSPWQTAAVRNQPPSNLTGAEKPLSNPPRRRPHVPLGYVQAFPDAGARDLGFSLHTASSFHAVSRCCIHCSITSCPVIDVSCHRPRGPPTQPSTFRRRWQHEPRSGRLTLVNDRGKQGGVEDAVRPGCPKGRSEMRRGRCESVPPGRPRGERVARSLGTDPWADAGRARCSIPGSRSRVLGREPSRFLGVNPWKKPETHSIILEHPIRWKGFGVPAPKVFSPFQQNPKRGLGAS